MLPTWNVQRLEERIPFVAAAVGGRRMGKSTLVTHLLQTMSRRFDLVISFTGTSACSPEMRELMHTRWDPRFQFAEWRQPLMDALLKQQERLKAQGINRQICILVDDIILNSKDEDALSHLCLRGRHFNISVRARFRTRLCPNAAGARWTFCSCSVARWRETAKFCVPNTHITHAWRATCSKTSQNSLAW